jgi:hypothetical protein
MVEADGFLVVEKREMLLRCEKSELSEARF